MGNTIEGFNNNRYITIYSMSNSPYQDWQGDLLDKSFQEVGMPGEIYRLVSEDLDFTDRPFSKSDISKVFKMRSFAKLPTRTYTAMNKPGSLLELFRTVDIPDSTILLFLDPDMIFTKVWLPTPEFGTVYGQRWKGYSQEYCGQTQKKSYCPTDAIMYPFSLRAGDAKKMAQKYFNYSSVESDDWMVEMSALVAAITHSGLKLQLNDAVGLCNDWDNNNDPNAPIVHYCQCVKDKNGKELWCKRRHVVGQKVPDHSVATNRVDREVLKALQKYF